MKDFFKYLNAGTEDREWGLHLTVCGKSEFPPASVYPSAEHPTGYYFTWVNGRVLQEYQINYITEGNGFLENEFGEFAMKPGTLMIIPRGVWHRYRPAKKTGWTENYIGFAGPLADHYFNKTFVPREQSVFNIGIREEFIDTYYKIFDLVKLEKPGYQQIASGMVIKLLGYLNSWKKHRNLTGKNIEKIILETRFYMRRDLIGKINLQKIAMDNNIGYSYFRKMFKQYTGISPYQYHLDQKLMKAKELILSTDKSIKEISNELGFQSIHYFSRLFKKKTGSNPTDIRKAHI